jgi:hypothetical protein
MPRAATHHDPPDRPQDATRAMAWWAQMIIDPEAHTDAGKLERPAGSLLIAASFQMLRLRFGGDRERDADEVDPDE